MGKLPGAVIAGAIVGVIGAGIWAAIAYFAHLEIGWIAWLIGGAIGFAVSAAGARGGTGALVASVITVLAICGGKIITTNLVLKSVGSQLTMENYNQARREAAEFAKLTSRDQYAEFMVDYEYTESKSPDDVSEQEVRVFEMEAVPTLREFHTNPPGFEEWKQQVQARANLYSQYASLWDKLKETLSAFDLVFFALAIGTAYRLGYGSREETE